jgi:hypothetical protein
MMQVKIEVGAVAVLAAVMAACAPRARLEPLERSHPARAEAPEAPVTEPGGALRGSAAAARVPAPAAAASHGHGVHGGAGHGSGGGGAHP